MTVFSFLKSYGLWEKECFVELRNKGYNFDDDTTDIIVCESGDVHFFGNLSVVSDTVTSWKESRHHIDYTPIKNWSL